MIAALHICMNNSLAILKINPFHQGFLTGIVTIKLCEYYIITLSIVTVLLLKYCSASHCDPVTVTQLL